MSYFRRMYLSLDAGKRPSNRFEEFFNFQKKYRHKCSRLFLINSREGLSVSYDHNCFIIFLASFETIHFVDYIFWQVRLPYRTRMLADWSQMKELHGISKCSRSSMRDKVRNWHLNFVLSVYVQHEHFYPIQRIQNVYG